MEWGPRSNGVGFFCFHALGDTKQKKPTPLDRGPPLHVNRPLQTPPSEEFRPLLVHDDTSLKAKCELDCKTARIFVRKSCVL